MKNNPGKVFVLDSSMKASPSTMRNDLLTLSNIATQVRDRSLLLNNSNGKSTDAPSFNVPSQPVKKVIKVQLKNSKVVLRDCVIPKLEEVQQNATGSVTSFNRNQEYQDLAGMFEASRILSNQQKNNGEVFNSELTKPEEIGSKRQKKKKYWYPKKNEASDQELMVEEGKEARKQVKKNPQGVYFFLFLIYFTPSICIYFTRYILFQ